jgi:hypothetical protein
VQLAIGNPSVRQTLEAMGLVRIVSPQTRTEAPTFWPRTTTVVPVTISIGGHNYTLSTPEQLAAYMDCEIGVYLGSTNGPKVCQYSN